MDEALGVRFEFDEAGGLYVERKVLGEWEFIHLTADQFRLLVERSGIQRDIGQADGVVVRQGRPPSANPIPGAERQRAYRQRKSNQVARHTSQTEVSP